MEKKKYESPEMEIIIFKTGDIITSSNTNLEDDELIIVRPET